jgi:hypothetical protein
MTGAGGSVFRPRRVVPAAVVAALLAAAAILVMVEVITALLHRPAAVLPVTWLARLGRTTYWDDPRVLAGAAALAVIGLFLLALALSPGRPRAVAVRSEEPEVLMGVAPSGLARYAEDAAQSVEGVTGAKARTRRRRVRVRATTPLRDAEGLTEQVRHAVEQRFADLGLRRTPRLRVTVRGRED